MYTKCKQCGLGTGHYICDCGWDKQQNIQRIKPTKNTLLFRWFIFILLTVLLINLIH